MTRITTTDAAQAAALTVLATAAIALLMAVPADDARAWLLRLLLSKAFAAGLILAVAALYRAWLPVNPILKSYARAIARL